jgi:hypothetical protein
MPRVNTQGESGLMASPAPIDPENCRSRYRSKPPIATGIVSIDAGQQAQVDQGLESVADTDDQFLPATNSSSLSPIFVLSAQGLNHPGAVIVAPAEATAKGQDLKIVQTHITGNQGVDVRPLGYGPGKFKGIGGFMITVQAEPRQYQYIRF